jgi:hypothetical protein
MAITPEGIIKRTQTMQKKYGKDYYKKIGALGGASEAHGNKPRGFALDPELSKKALAKRWKKTID